MNSISRLGINERWFKSFQRVGKHKSPYLGNAVERAKDELSVFVINGFDQKLSSLSKFLEPVNPPDMGWEFIGTDLSRLAVIFLCEWEVQAVNKNLWNSHLSSSVISMSQLSFLVALHNHMLFPLRHHGESLKTINEYHPLFLAFGLILNADNYSVRLARLLLSAIRKGYYKPLQVAYSANFIIRLLADYFNEPSIIIKRNPKTLMKGEILGDPCYDSLFSVWRDLNPDILIIPLLAVCDVFTHHAFIGANSHHREFGGGVWTRTPVAVLLVFKLRQLLGLKNPEVDHPLLKSLAGNLPVNVKYEPDPLIEKLRTRMIQDGFNEELICNYYSA
jgi:hypothetical protein